MDKKEQAAKEALKYISQGNVVGLGSGTTAAKFIKILGSSTLRDKIVGVSTSTASEKLARESGIRTVDIDSVDWIDVTVDGADEVDKELNVLKGGGGQLTREKKVRNKSRNYVVIVSDEKIVERIPHKSPIPIEIIPFGRVTTMRELESLGMKCKFREGFITDNGNTICDCSPLEKFDLHELSQKIKLITGVVENGLFLGDSKTVLVADGEKVTVMKI